MNIGIVVLVIIGVVTLGQVFIQGMERRREHKELLDRFDHAERKHGGQS